MAAGQIRQAEGPELAQLSLQAQTAFPHLPSVRTTDLEAQQCVDIGSSPTRSGKSEVPVLPLIDRADDTKASIFGTNLRSDGRRLTFKSGDIRGFVSTAPATIVQRFLNSTLRITRGILSAPFLAPLRQFFKPSKPDGMAGADGLLSLADRLIRDADAPPSAINPLPILQTGKRLAHRA